jgi:MtrB/PioB family decaheme-associated outer membrane protein
MNWLHRRCCLWLALAALSPTTAAASGCGSVVFGAGWLDGPGMRFGRYAGQAADHSFGVLQIDACGHYAAGVGRWVLRIDDAGLGSRRASLGMGVQGRYRIELEHRRLAGARDVARTPLQGLGSSNLLLPAGWTAAPTTAAMSSLLPSLGEFDLGSTRRRTLLGLSVVLPESWQLDTRVRDETRSGIKPFAGLIGHSGGTPRVVVLPEPIDGRTREFDTALHYAAGARQFRIGYKLSLFDNSHTSLRWQNPYAAIAGWHPSAGFPSGSGQAQPAPDNQFHQLSLGLAQQLAPQLRLNADLALGRMLQDQTFLPYSINPSLQDSITQPLPRASLDGRIDTSLLNLRLSSRPPQGWHWNLFYRFDERDNRTPQAEYVSIGGDAQTQDSATASSRRRINLPYGFREQRLGVDAGTRIGGDARLDLGAQHSQIDRTWSARERTEESRLQLGLRGDPREWLNLALRVIGSDRGGSTHIGNRAFLAGHAPAYIESVPGAFENLPDLRSYALADRRRLQSSLALGIAPAAQWSLALTHGSTRDSYARSELGLTRANIRDLNLDASFSASEAWTLHAFAAREWMAFDQDGRSFQGGAARLQQAADPARNWQAEHRDRVDTMGLGARRALRDGRLRVGVDYARSQVAGDVRVSTAAALTALPLPTTRARLTTLDIDLAWRLGTRSELLLGYRREAFRSSDWARDGVAPNTLANVILLGEESPDYSAHALALSYRTEF